MNEETRYRREPIYKCQRCGEIVNTALLETQYTPYHVCETDENGNQKKVGLLELIGYDFREIE